MGTQNGNLNSVIGTVTSLNTRLLRTRGSMPDTGMIVISRQILAHKFLFNEFREIFPLLSSGWSLKLITPQCSVVRNKSSCTGKWLPMIRRILVPLSSQTSEPRHLSRTPGHLRNNAVRNSDLTKHQQTFASLSFHNVI